MLKQSKAKEQGSTGTVIFLGLKRTTLVYRAYAYEVTTALLVSLNNEKSAMLVSKSILRELNSSVLFD